MRYNHDIIPAEIYKHCHSLSTGFDIVRITLVLLELTSIRDGAFCLHQFDDDLVRSLIGFTL